MSGTNTGGASGRVWFYGALGFIVAWALYLRFFGPMVGGLGSQLEGSGLDSPADYDWRVTDLSGKRYDLTKLEGKTVFLNIWATWCAPCVKEMPTIAKLAARPELRDVVFLCVATDDSPVTVQDHVKGKDWPMTILHASEIPRVFSTDGIPATFLIGPDKKVAASLIGSADWDDPTVVTLLQTIQKGNAAK